jgi:hypothetical protein
MSGFMGTTSGATTAIGEITIVGMTGETTAVMIGGATTIAARVCGSNAAGV